MSEAVEQSWSERRLRSRGWTPVVRERVVGSTRVGSRRVPVVDGFEMLGWAHPSLEHLWPEPDALRLEDEHDNGNPQVLSLLEEMDARNSRCPGA